MNEEITRIDMPKRWLQKAQWYAKQLLPLTYRTTFTSEGVRYFEVWNMWMGRTFNHESHKLAGD